MRDRSSNLTVNDEGRRVLERLIEEQLAHPHWIQVHALQTLRIALEDVRTWWTTPEQGMQIFAGKTQEIRFHLDWQPSISQSNCWDLVTHAAPRYGHAQVGAHRLRDPVQQR